MLGKFGEATGLAQRWSRDRSSESQGWVWVWVLVAGMGGLGKEAAPNCLVPGISDVGGGTIVTWEGPFCADGDQLPS